MKIRIATGLIALCLANPAFAQTSIALGQPDDIQVDGVSIGIAYNQPNKAAADREALRQCRYNPEVTSEVRDLCTVVARFDNRCIAVAMDPRAGTYGFGWAVFETQADADKVALINCRATAREERDHCVITTRRCDGTAG